MAARNDLKGSAVLAGRRVNLDTRTRVNVWDDMSDAVDDILNATGKHLVAAASRKVCTERNPWSGSETFDAAREMLQSGWSEHREQVERVLAQVADDPSIERIMADRFAWQYNYGGEICDVGRYSIGEPECMMSPVMVSEDSMGPVVRIMLNGSASSGVPIDVIVKRGVMVAALVDTLVKLGRGVEVWWSWQSESTAGGHKIRHGSAVKIKSTDEPMDVDDLLFVSASPAMLRRFGFALSELESDETRKAHNFGDSGEYGYGYGQPCDFTREELAAVVGGHVHVSFGKVHAHDDYSDPVKHVLKHLEGLNVATD